MNCFLFGYRMVYVLFFQLLLFSTGNILHAFSSKGHHKTSILQRNLKSQNFGFEKKLGKVYSKSSVWWWGGTGYKFSSDSSVKHSGRYSGKIESVSHGTFGSITSTIKPSFVAGKRIKCSAWIKVENVKGYAGFWFRGDIKKKAAVFNNMYEQNISGTQDWKCYSFELDIPRDVYNINLGFLLSGTGTAWCDDIKIEEVSKTDMQNSDVSEKTLIFKYGDGKPNGKKQLAKDMAFLKFDLPVEKERLLGLKIYASRYGASKSPEKTFSIYILNEDLSQVLHTVKGSYKILKKGINKWCTVNFHKDLELPKAGWIAIDFESDRVNGGYLSYDSKTKGLYSRMGPSGEKSRKVPFRGDWMIQMFWGKKILLDQQKSLNLQKILSKLNLDFEKGKNTQSLAPFAWFRHGKGYKFTVDTAVKHSGKYAGKIERYAQGDDGHLLSSFDYRLVAGKRIKCSAWIKTKNVKNLVSFWFRGHMDKAGSAYKPVEEQIIKGTMDWKEYSFEKDIPKEVFMVDYGVSLYGGGTVWCDDIKIEIIGDAKPLVKLKQD